MEHPAIQRRLTYLDTFDSRLSKNNLVAVYQDEAGKPLLLVRQLGSGDEISRTPVESQPEFATDIAAWLRPEILGKAIKMRRLLPLVQSSASAHSVDVVDKKGNVVIRLELFEECLRYRNHRKGECLPLKLIAKANRGYESSIDDLHQLAEQLKLSAYEQDSYLQLLDLQNLQPSSYSNKIDVLLDPKSTVLQAYQTLFKTLYRTMQLNEDGIRKDIDTEFLHDYRVSVRRTRSLLSRAKGIMPEEFLNEMAEDFKWLGSVTSPMRDDDVWLLSFDEYQNALPGPLKSHLEPLRGWLQHSRQQSFKDVVAMLDSDRYRRLMSLWQSFVEAGDKQSESAELSTANSLEVARQRIWKTYMTLRKRGELIQDDSPPEMLHDLRKTCKKLRYMLEFFQSLFPEKQLVKAIKRMQKLQDFLGVYQDYAVQRESLNHFMDGMREEHELTSDAQQAIEYLIKDLADREAQHRTHFATYFQAYEHPDVHELYTRLFK